MANKFAFSFTNAGFFSEINNFILGVLYAEKNNLELVVDFSSLEFVDKATLNSIIDFQNHDLLKSEIISNSSTRTRRSYLFPYTGIAKVKKLIEYYNFNMYYRIYSLIADCDTDIMQKHWTNIRNQRFQLNQNDRDFLYKITKQLWIHNSQNKYSNLGEYIGVHIRKGDKINETEFHSNDKYIYEIEKYSKIYKTREVVLFTDNVKDGHAVKQILRGHNIHLISLDKEGYIHKEFLKQTSHYKTKNTLALCDIVNTMVDSSHFIGSNDGNLSAFTGLLRSGNNISDLRMSNLVIY